MRETWKNLRLFNLIMGLFHLAQAGLMIYLSNDSTLPLTTSFLGGSVENFTDVPQTEVIADVRLGPLVSLFLLISAGAHLLISSPMIYEWYQKNLAKGKNLARWYEYSFSSSIMIVVIGMLCGIYDLPSLILMFSLNAVMILCGLLMEVHNQTTKKTNWLSFIIGCFAGIIPWLVIFMYFAGAVNSLDVEVPDFVYGIVISLFISFNIFAVNMVLQYKKIGPWKNYIFGERMYILLSLIAKSALAWQVFSGTLR